jgi:hypothetical protein
MVPRSSSFAACAIFLVSLAGPMLSWTFAAESLPSQDSEKVPVICPAVEADDSQRPVNAPGMPSRVDLVVLGTAKRLDETTRWHQLIYELKVEKTLYGSTTDKTLRFHSYCSVPESERRIFALAQAYGDPRDFELTYEVDIKVEKSQMAMSAARLDYRTLAADTILVGKETVVDVGADRKYRIEVVRLLHGSEPKPGTEVIYHFQVVGKIAESRPEPMLFFVHIGSDFLNRKEYRVDARLPIACEADVVSALKRRDLYPIVNTTEQDKTLRAREIVFRGSVEEAIDFLGSERTGHGLRTDLLT